MQRRRSVSYTHLEALLRPHNYPQAPGTGWGVYATPFGRVAVINLIGRTFLALSLIHI